MANMPGAMMRNRMTTTERATRAAHARANGNRRKKEGHPATADMDYSADETEFMLAIQAFKAKTGKKFPTWSEALRVLRSLGYTKSFPEAQFDEPC